MKDSTIKNKENRVTEAETDFFVGDKARRQACAFLSNYTSDVSGVCSALYELGGMVVMHDPSGCNSTYNTHDEPRWYDKDSLIFISGLSQIDAILGNDDKLIDDIVRAARDLHPAFIALVRTPVPMMTGTDFDAIARMIELETGIPVWYFPTSGMNSYVRGAGMAMEKVARCLADQEPAAGGADQGLSDTAGLIGDRPVRVNVLGSTPLDFSINETRASLLAWLGRQGFILQSMFAMGDGDAQDMRCQIRSAGLADVSLVVSSVGLPAARALKERFGIPYVIGFPCASFGLVVDQALRKAARTGEDQKDLFITGFNIQEEETSDGNEVKGHEERTEDKTSPGRQSGKENYIIGEPVIALSLASAAWTEDRESYQVICPLELDEDLLGAGCLKRSSEDDLIRTLQQGQNVLADPIYKKICPPGTAFTPFPHEAYSGRIYRTQMPDLMEGIRGFSRNPPGDPARDRKQL